MANHLGSEGSIAIGANVIAEVKSWSKNEAANTVDTTLLTDAWSTHKTGVKSWSFSVEAFWDETDTAGQGALTIGTSIPTFNLYPEGSTTGDTYWTGTATVTSIDNSAAIDGIVEASFSITGTGALAEATVA